MATIANSKQKIINPPPSTNNFDVSDPASLSNLFTLTNKKNLTDRQSHFLTQARFKVSKHHSGVEYIDFTCKDSGYSVGDGNTICDGKFVRRGL